MRHYSAWVSEADQRAAGTIAPRMPARPQPADLPPRAEIEPKHPFERIAVDLRERIYAGDLRIGLPIPSVKELAREHGISASTAQRAIQLLSQWGLVRVEPGRPTFVAPREKNVVEVTVTPADTVAPSQALELEVRRLGTAIATLRTRADPNDSESLHRLLLGAIKRHGCQPAEIDDFELVVRAADGDQRVIATYVALAP
jgi:DNA-binding transcriptional regulator YhcF (GntR family)